MIKIALEGRGGQGVLTLGVILGRILDKEYTNVSISPSYTAEMFGGPCYCYVVASNSVTHNPIPESANVAVDFNDEKGVIISKTVNPDTLLISAKPSRVKTEVTSSLGQEGEREFQHSISGRSKIPINIHLLAVISHLLELKSESIAISLKEQFEGFDSSDYLDLINEVAGSKENA